MNDFNDNIAETVLIMQMNYINKGLNEGVQ